MKLKKLGRTDWEISTISFGAWAIGGTWGHVDDAESLKALHKAIDLGVNFIDTADVYGDGHSERLIGKLKKERKESIIIATKAGRRSNPHTAESYNRKNLTLYVERSLRNLNVDAIDLLQLHCPPTQVYYMPEVFGVLDDLTRDGKLKYYGVSVEKVEEGLKALEFPNIQSVQIIFNMFRQRPSERFFELAKRRDVGIIARVPLASGLLAGKLNKNSSFEQDDHRFFNRHGEEFDRGETFSGIDYHKGLEAVESLKSICPTGMSLSQFAIRWILMFDAVTCAIPGAKREEQVMENIQTIHMNPVSLIQMEQVKNCYEKFIKGSVHQYW